MSQELDKSVLSKIEQRAEETHSDALMIIHNGKVVLEKYSSDQLEPIYLASAGKSLVSLGIGRLFKLGLLDSLDQPVHSLFPEWKQGQKKDITIRMLLDHTSGIQNYANASIELEPAPDYQVDNVIQLALAAELSRKPGEVISYNNKAVALLGGVIERASGKRMDQFFEQEFYSYMDIKQYGWIQDKAGNPTAHGAFKLLPQDFAKFGELMLDGGKYNGHQIVDTEWVEMSLEKGKDSSHLWSLLWWRMPKSEKRIIRSETLKEWEEKGVESGFIDKVRPMTDKEFSSKQEYFAVMSETLGKGWYGQISKHVPEDVKVFDRIVSEEMVAYYAHGSRGIYLVVIPDKQIIAIRCADPYGYNWNTDGFGDFVELVSKL